MRVSFMRFALLAVAFASAAAHAQLIRTPIGVPGVRLPDIQLPQRDPLPARVLEARVPEVRTRGAAALDLLRQRPDVVEADPRGEPIRRAQVLWLSPSPQAVLRARQAGFTVLQDTQLPELEVRELVLQVPPGVATAAAAEQLRAFDASATVDFNHLYQPSGATGGDAAPGVAHGAGTTQRIGLVDSGVDTQHPALRHVAVRSWGCNGQRVPAAHGTAVASLLAGHDGPFTGVQPTAALHAADVYCGDDAAASADTVARAIAWMLAERVPVINVSLVGPANRLLELATAAAVRRGHLVVAAVGNEGPAAPPLYPAAYPGVVAVTAVGTSRRALPEAGQGAHVAFAARGDLQAARVGGGYARVRGTSYAVPLVAGMLAGWLPEPSPDAAAAAIARLARDAVDLGTPGRDAVYGFGLVGEAGASP